MAKSFENREGWIWMNGEFIPWEKATSHIVSQGLHYASACLLYTSPSPRDLSTSRMPSSA